MKFRDYFTNSFETTENHYIETLRTRYYRARSDEVKRVAKELIDIEKGLVKADDEVHFEIVFDSAGYSGTFTIVSPRIGETAVDIKINTYNLIGMGQGKKVIERLYDYFDKHLTYKGVGLYKGR